MDPQKDISPQNSNSSSIKIVGTEQIPVENVFSGSVDSIIIGQDGNLYRTFIASSNTQDPLALLLREWDLYDPLYDFLKCKAYFLFKI